MKRGLKKSELYGSLGTLLFCIITLLILIFCKLSSESVPKTPDGIEINFGDGGGEEGSPAPLSESQQNVSSSTNINDVKSEPSSTSEAPNLMSQKDPSVAIAEEQRRAENQRIKQEQLQQEQAQRIAQQKAAQSAKAAQMAAGAFGKGGSGRSGHGSGNGFGNTPGNPLGHGTVGGNSWSLAGRNLRGGFTKPAYVGNQEGKVVVSIIVDRNGNVIGANVISGTTISEKSLLEECKHAARRIKFSSSNSNGNVSGTITYRFSQD